MGKVIFDCRNQEYKKPFGAVTGGQAVEYRVFMQDEKRMYFVLRRDDLEEEQCIPMKRGRNPNEWVHKQRFAEKGLYFYRFECDGGYIARNPPDSVGYVTDDPDGGWFIQIVYDGSYIAPATFAGRVIYQIFPDRFYRESVLKPGFADRVIHKDLDDIPDFRPVNNKVKNNDFFGGNLKGIEKKLPYLKQLGVGIIYLNPIFESHSNHRYDTADYMKIDPLLGDEKTFARFCEAARKNDIRIILDGVFSHTGADSLYFDKYGRYEGGLGAYNNPDSPYRSWYKFDKNEEYGYHSWWGFETLPEVNETDESFRDFICGGGGVIDHWMSLGASGFRLDVADELPDSFIRDIRQAIKRHGDDTLLIGEVWEDASIKIAYGERRQYLLGEELDSVMNYPFREAILDFVREADAGLFIHRVMEIIENYPKPMMDVMMNLLSTHDTERLVTSLTQTEQTRDREWQVKQALSRDDYLRGVEMAKLAFSLLFTLPGLPAVYYGDEIGMQGYRDPFNRGYFKWNNIDDNLRDYVAELSETRKENGAFTDGIIVPLTAKDGCVAYIRQNAVSKVAVIVNRSQETKKIRAGRRVFTVAPWKAVIERIEG